MRFRERFPGFYRPSDDDFERLWADGLVVPDANVLLTFYRLSESAREDVFRIFEELGDRLWSTHQAGLEYQRNRLGVIAEQIRVYDDVLDQIRTFREQLVQRLRRHPRLEREKVSVLLDDGLQAVQAHIETQRDAHPDPLTDGDQIGADVVRDRLDALFADRLGEPLDTAEVAKQGKDRYERKVPPGYRDADKPEGERYGDLAIWLEMLGKAQVDARPVILVTEDTKDDWWWSESGQTLGPRLELVDEMFKRTGQRFYMYRLDRFVEEAAARLDVALQADTPAEVTKARAPQPVFAWSQPVTTWQPTLDTGAFHIVSEPTTARGPFRTFGDSSWWTNWATRSRTEIVVDASGAILTFSNAGNAALRDVACTVAGPSGTSHHAFVTFDDRGGASARYPSEFQDAKLVPGQHRFAWSVPLDGATDRWILDSGDFTVPGPGTAS